MANIVNLSWNDIDFLADRLVEQIYHKDLKFDTILALSRGGLVPGSILSYKLKVSNLQNLGINTREDNGKFIDTIIYQKPGNVEGKVLVVDDINDSGKTFTAVSSYIASNYDIDKNDAYYASLTTKSSSEFSFNTITGNIFYTDSWLVFPWDK